MRNSMFTLLSIIIYSIIGSYAFAMEYSLQESLISIQQNYVTISPLQYRLVQVRINSPKTDKLAYKSGKKLEALGSKFSPSRAQRSLLAKAELSLDSNSKSKPKITIPGKKLKGLFDEESVASMPIISPRGVTSLGSPRLSEAIEQKKHIMEIAATFIDVQSQVMDRKMALGTTIGVQSQVMQR